MGRKRRGLFVDLDGTLIDNLSSMKKAYEDFLGCFGCVASDEEFDSLNGPPLDEVVRRLRAAHNLEPEHDVLVARYMQTLLGHYARARANDGAELLLTTARDAGMPRVVVTSSTERFAEIGLRHAGLIDLIDFVVCGDATVETKPSPAPYLYAVAKAGCETQHSIAIEDSMRGSQSAVRAGLSTYVLGARRPPDEWPGIAGFVPSLGAAAALLADAN